MRKYSILILLVFLCGCGGKNELELARENAARSRLYYQHAVECYKNMISADKDAALAHFELGQLYYEHGDYERARGEFRTTSAPGAARYLALTDYRLGDYSGALEQFNRNIPGDDESRYYYGLTAEKLYLYDQALGIYRQINGPAYRSKAQARIDAIHKGEASRHISELSPELSSLLANSPAASQYPQAGAIVISCDESMEIKPDNTQMTSAHYIIKILNERGKEDLAEAKIDYDSTDEKVELEYARTIKPDGQVAEVGVSNIRDVTKYMDFPLYSNARLYIISFPEVEIGSVIEYKVNIKKSRLINKKDFIEAYPLQAAEPILSASFSVTLPKDRPLRLKVINNEYNDFGARLAPQQEEQKDGRRKYSWQFHDLPQIIPEPKMPPEPQINPTVLLSTFSDWQQVYDWWWALSRDKIKADQPIKDKVAELIKGKTTPEEKMRAIHDYCARNIRYVAVEYGQAGYEPHQAADIFRNKYGDCKDQAVLLVTMLKEAGVPAYLVLISTYDYYNLEPDLPSALFDHCIAAALINGQYIFLDPTASVCSSSDLPVPDQERKVLVFQDAGFKIMDTPLFAPEHNSVDQEMNINLERGGSIKARRVITSGGFFDQAQRYWLLYTQPDLIKETLKEKIQEVSIGANLLDYKVDNLDDLDKPVILRYEFSGPEYLTTAGRWLMIAPRLTSMDSTLAATDKRQYPLDLGVPNIRETSVTVTVPDDLVVKYMPDNIQMSSPWLNYSAGYARNGHRITFRQRAEFRQRRIPAQEYAEFKKFFDQLANSIKQNIILERKK